MPTNDYLCEGCGPFEEWQNITAPTLDLCPKCSGKVKRLISKNISVIFKGSGFYTTDNRPAPPTEADTPSTKSDSPAATSPPPSAESKEVKDAKDTRDTKDTKAS